MTFKKLVEGLGVILKNHPEFANKEVYCASECGCWTTGFDSPVTIAVPIFTSEFQDSKPYIRIVSDDDGYRTSEAIADWKFISSEEKQAD